MWWPGALGQWYEAHNSPGTTTTGTKWGLAEGEVGGGFNTETYILIANTSSYAGTARITLLVPPEQVAAATTVLDRAEAGEVMLPEEDLEVEAGGDGESR
jgi:hypothetical protein